MLTHHDSLLRRFALFFRSARARRRSRRNAQPTETLEHRILPAITFQFSYDGAIGSGVGFEDANDGQARRDALETTARQLGNLFDHTATIELDVTSIEDQNSDSLASASTAFAANPTDGFENNEVVRTKILTGTDLNGDDADGMVEVNWGLDWGTSANAADVTGSEFDFVSTMYHELLHAVGWASTISETGGDLNDAAPAGQAGAWSYFDQFITDSAGTSVIDGTTFALNSTSWTANSVGGASQANGLFFNGLYARAYNGGRPVGLYTPTTWSDGSSVSHLDDENNSLAGSIMLAETEAGPGTRTLSPVERAVLQDLGYSFVTPGISIAESSDSTVVSETGSIDTIEVTLTAQPLSNVVLSLSNYDPTEYSLDTNSLTFTPANWNVAQTVTVKGEPDYMRDGYVLSEVVLSIDTANSDNAYHAVANASVQIRTIDTDGGSELLVDQTGGSTSVRESGTTDTISVRLNSAPASDVVVNIGAIDSGELEVSDATLTFTSANWFTSQQITVTGIDDARQDGNQSTIITIAVDDAQSADSFDGATDLQMLATTVDNETLSTPTFLTTSGTVGQRPTIEWQPVSSASSYEIWINRLGDPNTIALKQSGLTETSFTLPQDLPVDNRYVVWVRAHNATESSIYSNSIRLTVGSPPAATTPTGPTDTATARPTFQWEAVSGATAYDLWVNQIGGTSRIIREASLGTNSFTATSDLADGQYRFWVRAYNGAGLGPWSSSLTFSIGSPPGTTTVTAPTGSTTARPLFEWTAAAHASTYELWVNQVGGTTRIIHDTAVAGTSFQADSDLAAGTYRFWVRAIGSSGVRGAWTAAATFEVA